MRRLDLEHVPVAVRLVARGPGHVVLDATAGRQIVFGERGRIGRRPPPALELARIRPQLPNALDRRIEFGLNGQGEPLGVLADSGDGHRLLSFVCSVSMAPAVSAMSSFMRSIRARHSSSYWSSRRRATSSASRLVRTTLPAADALLRDQACALENRDVLLDRREAHRVMAGQLEDALLGADRAADDVAACVIREGGEHAVEARRRDLHADTTIGLYQHRVKARASGRSA